MEENGLCADEMIARAAIQLGRSIYPPFFESVSRPYLLRMLKHCDKSLHLQLDFPQTWVLVTWKHQIRLVRLLWHKFHARISQSTDDQTKEDMNCHFHCLCTKVHQCISWSREPGHQIHDSPDPLLFQSKHQAPSTLCNIQSWRNLKPLQPRNVVHLADTWQVAWGYALQSLVVRTCQHVSVQ